MNKKRSAPTMKDVAQEAGVALGTVSKVFNGLPVGESYKKRVEEAAKKLGYQVNNYARGLRASRTNTVAVILPSVNHAFFGMLAEHLCRFLMARGQRTLLAITNLNPGVEQECVNMVQQNKVDGIIGLTYHPDLQFDESVPFVSIDRPFNPKVPCVSSDNYSGGQLAAQKLVELGCKRLLVFQQTGTTPGEVDKRRMGFDAAAALETALSSLAADGNGDGRVVVQVNQYAAAQASEEASSAAAQDDGERAFSAQAAQAGLIADLERCDSFLFLLEDGETFQKGYQILAHTDGTLPSEMEAPSDRLWLNWTDCPVLAGLDLGSYTETVAGTNLSGDSQTLLSRLKLARRGFWTGTTCKNPETCEELWNTVTKGAKS